jgi:peptidoglycan LD-endopeptidase LytH
MHERIPKARGDDVGFHHRHRRIVVPLSGLHSYGSPSLITIEPHLVTNQRPRRSNPMEFTRINALALFATLAIGFSAVGACAFTDSAQANASAEQPEFVLTSFPHDTTAVNFWDSWGARRSGGRRHTGTDILSPRGTRIVAVAEGTVTAFGTNRLSGVYLRLDHGGGWTSTYMHLNNDTLGTDDGNGGVWTALHPLISVGTAVRAGQVIGYVGNSGNAEGRQPHTHFELAYAGNKINPYPYLRDVWNRQMRIPAAAVTPR